MSSTPNPSTTLIHDSHFHFHFQLRRRTPPSLPTTPSPRLHDPTKIHQLEATISLSFQLTQLPLRGCRGSSRILFHSFDTLCLLHCSSSFPLIALLGFRLSRSLVSANQSVTRQKLWLPVSFRVFSTLKATLPCLTLSDCHDFHMSSPDSESPPSHTHSLSKRRALVAEANADAL